MYFCFPAALNGSGIRSWQPGEPLFENLVALAKQTGAANLIWYQGCTDTDEPDEYEELLERMLRELKNRLSGVSILIVQLSGTTNEKAPSIARGFLILEITFRPVKPPEDPSTAAGRRSGRSPR